MKILSKLLIYTFITTYFIGSIIEVDVHAAYNTAYDILAKLVFVMTMTLCCIWLEVISED